MKKNKIKTHYVVYEDVYEERRGLSFGMKLLIYALVLGVLIAGGVMLLRRALSRYEAAQPDRVVESYIATNARSAFYHAILRIYPDDENTYEPVYDIASALADRYAGKFTCTRLVRESTVEAPVYLLQSGDENLLKVTLEQTGETVFLGAPVYRVATTELVLSEQLSLTDYGIVFPAEGHAFINGRHVTVEAADTESFTIFGGDGSLISCLPASFFSRPEVRVLVKGKEIFPEEGEHFIFDPENVLRTLYIEAPAEATVRIDGVKVSSLFVTGEKESEPDAFGRTVPMLEYTVPTVSGRGAVTVSQDGVALMTETVNEYTSALPLSKAVTVRIPPTAVLYADGEAVPPAGFVTTMKEALLSETAGLAGAPKSHTYVFARLYSMPTFTATDGGEALVPVRDGDASAFVPVRDEALQTQYTSAATAFMNAYLHYTTQGFRNTRENLDALQVLVDGTAPLHAALERSLIGYQFASPQTVTVREMRAENFRPLGGDLFCCELAYKLEVANFVGKTDDENTLRVTFRLVNGAPLAVALTQVGK